MANSAVTDAEDETSARVMVLAGLLAAGAFVQSNLFDRYDVNRPS